jgi:diaminopimelate epimerase
MVEFTKYQGTGNDYLFIDGRETDEDWSSLAARMSDRHFGVGADGIIVATTSAKAPVRMRMFNADGSEGEMCGNGIRCFTKFVIERDIIERPGEGPVDVETGAGLLSIQPRWQAGRVTGARVDMGTPILKAVDVPVWASQAGPSNHALLDTSLVEAMGLSADDLLFDSAIEVSSATFVGTAVSMGNPHFVAFVQQPVDEMPLEYLGPLVEHHPAFPKRVNFHIVNIDDRGHLVSRTWERGSGITLACGTGASAMVVAARLHGLVDDEVRVTLPGGDLTITWPGYGSLFMEGDAVEVFSGAFEV